MFHPRTYIFFRRAVRCLVLILRFFAVLLCLLLLKVIYAIALVKSSHCRNLLVSELRRRRLSFLHPKDWSPRAPQPALAGVKARKGTAVPYFRIFNYSVLSFIFNTIFFYLSCLLDTPTFVGPSVQLRRKELFMQLQANFNFLNSARQLFNKINSGSAALNAHVRNTGGQVYGLSGPSAASRVNGNYQRYLQLNSDSPVAAGIPHSSNDSSDSDSSAPAPSSPASNPWNSYAFADNGSIGSSSAKSWDYLNADLARQYGMSRETAYQEALSNTGYQRSVADMQAAGLNPSAIFGAGSGYQASGVGYVSAATPSSGGSGYVAQTGVSRRGWSAKAQTDYNLTGKQYALIQLLGAGIGALATKSFAGALSGAAIGRYVAQYVGNK